MAPPNKFGEEYGGATSRKQEQPASPVKKRNKLSLKGKPSVLGNRSPKASAPGRISPFEAEYDDGEVTLKPQKVWTPLRATASPCVAGLHNLGNTCYLNSVLQVLRYTPGFVEGLNSLVPAIAQCRSEQAWVGDRKKQEERGDYDEEREEKMYEKEILSWEFSRYLKELYEKMDKIESDYRSGKTSFITIRPYDVLHTIEQLNPMFEGNEQHDAHEVLGCMMAYVQDAVAEINKHRESCIEASPTDNREMDTNNSWSSKASPGTYLNKDAKSRDDNIETKTATGGNRLNKATTKCRSDNDIMEISEDGASNIVAHSSKSKSKASLSTQFIKDTKRRVELNKQRVTNIDVEEIPFNFKLSPISRMNKEENSADSDSFWIDPEAQQVIANDIGSLCGTGFSDITTLDLRSSFADAKVSKNMVENPSNGSEDSEIKVDNSNSSEETENKVKNSNSSEETENKVENSSDTSEESEIKFKNSSKSSEETRNNVKNSNSSEETENKVENSNNSEETEIKAENSSTDSSTENILSSSGTFKVSSSNSSNSSKKSRKSDENLFTLESTTPSTLSSSTKKYSRIRGNVKKGILTPSMQVDGVCDFDSLKLSTGKSQRRQSIKRPRSSDDDTNSANQAQQEIPQENEQTVTTTLTTGSNTNKKRLGTSRVVKTGSDAVKPVRTAFKAPFKLQNVEKDIEAPKSITMRKRGSLDNKDIGNNKVGNIFKASIVGKPKPTNKQSLAQADSALFQALDIPTKAKRTVRAEEKRESLVDATLSPVKSSDEQSNRPALKAKALSSNPSVKLQRLTMTNFFKKVDKEKEDIPDRCVEKVPDYIEEQCYGMTALRTRCMECENHTQRTERFQDISVAVKKDSPPCESDGEEEDKENVPPTKWLMEALGEVEKLEGNNKYYCDICLNLVEAERSTNYTKMPPILTLHLKRFAAMSGSFGNFTKITDHVPVPSTLPCFRDSCKGEVCRKVSHRYSLYGVITHMGHSLSSGHYVAYVRAPPGHQYLPPKKAATPKAPKTPTGSGSNIAKALTFDDGDDDDQMVPDFALGDEESMYLPIKEEEITSQSSGGGRKRSLDSPNNKASKKTARTNPRTSTSSSTSSSTKPKRLFGTPLSPVTLSPHFKKPACATPNTPKKYTTGTEWFECDDEFVTVLSEDKMDEVMSRTSHTPYLLFYKQCESEER